MHVLLHELVLRSANAEIATAVLLLSDLLALLSIPSVIGQRRGRPASQLAWILALIALPYVGALTWWVFGRTHLERKRRSRRQSHAVFSGSTGRPTRAPTRAFEGIVPPGVDGSGATTDGNEVTLLVDGKRAFPAMEDAIRRAEHSVDALFYIWTADETGRRMRDLLVERARAGVDVRLLLDGLGTIAPPPGFFGPLRRAGGKVGTFLPIRPWHPSGINFRNHRKLVVVDGEVAFTGGMNVGRDYEHDWHDLVVRVRGPGVAPLQDVFLDDWFYATGELREVDHVPEPRGSVAMAVLASGPDQWDNRVHDTIFLALSQARRRVWLMTPYFVPGPGILAALRAAAQRGLDVRLLVPRRADVPLARLAGRALYPILVDAGVQIWEFDGMLHGKALLIDRDLSLVGSANTDNRSFRLNFELSCLFRSESIAVALEEVFRADFARAALLGRERAHQEPRIDAILGSLAQLVSPLL